MKYKFAKDFLWGAATSSYQIEGAYNKDGKGESIWDSFCKRNEVIEDESDGNIACNHYELWEEDVELMAKLNLQSYRFSISWPRIIPNGIGFVEERGIDFYNKLIDKLLENNIEPIITLYHWDLPQALEDIGGWANRDIVDAFENYTKIIVERFGDRVKIWNTINEPMVLTRLGYFWGIHAPGHQDEGKYFKAIHNVNLAHAKSYKVLKSYNKNFKIGIAQALFPSYPAQDDDKLIEEVKLLNDEMMWVHVDPVIKGEYPKSIVKKVEKYNGMIIYEDLNIIKNTSDFLGVNLYSRMVIDYDENGKIEKVLVPNSEVTDIGWEVYPDAMFDMLNLLKDKYDNIPIYITENGASYQYPVTNGKVHDAKRVEYLQLYISAIYRAIENGCNVKGYSVWSLLDNFEWSYGYSQRFGIIDVNYSTQKRTIKDSGYFYADLIKNRGFEKI